MKKKEGEEGDERGRVGEERFEDGGVRDREESGGKGGVEEE
jgi:hypothetical protein